MSEENIEPSGAENVEPVNPFSSPAAFQAELDKAKNPPAAEEIKEEIETAKEPAAIPDEDDEFIDTDKGKMIPKSRFEKEAAKRKEIESRLQQEHDARIKVERDLENLNAAIQQHLQPGKEQPNASDDFQIDPLDPETTNALTKQIKALEAKLDAMQNGNNADKANASYANALERQEAEVRSKYPDWTEAYQHLRTSLYNENIALGMDEKSAGDDAMNDLRKRAAIAFKSNKNVAEVAYQMAKDRGYIPKTAQPQRKTGADLGKIAQNMDKSASVSDVPATSTGSGGMSYTPELLQKIGGGKKFFPAAEFAKLIAQQQR